MYYWFKDIHIEMGDKETIMNNNEHFWAMNTFHKQFIDKAIYKKK